jgi:hypothetical protein
MDRKTNLGTKAYIAAGFSVLLLAAGLAGCTTPAAYAPQTRSGGPGYSDERLAQNRYRVTFTGNSATSRVQVEDYLLFRAAQVTLASGFAAFAFDARDTKAKTTYFSTFDRGPYAPFWPDYDLGWYWHSWAFDDVQSRPITRYEAYAEIVMLTAEQAKSEPRALDARDVIDHVGPRVALPPPPPAN